MSLTRISQGIAAALCLALASPALAFDALGEIQGRNASAAFDDRSVIGPHISVYREGDGRWVGRIRGRVIDAYEVKNGVRGANFALYFEKRADGKIVRGHWGRDTVYVHIPNDLRQREELWYDLKGAANQDVPPLPQFLFAVLAAL